MKNLLHPHHFIFSVENALHEARAKTPTTEEAVSWLRKQGEDAEIIDGVYGGKPERSILVSDPRNVKSLINMAKDLGQESVLHSSGGKHSLIYVNGIHAGKQLHGEGTSWHTDAPEDNYSIINSPEGPVHFSHNFDFNKPFSAIIKSEDPDLEKGAARRLFPFNPSDMSEHLEKMSLPRITFPHFKDITTRPDQQIQTIATPQQKEIFGRKAAQAALPDKEENYSKISLKPEGGVTVHEEGKRKVSRQPIREREAARLGRRFGTNILGMVAGSTGMGAALAGKLRSRYEQADDEHKEKLDAHAAKKKAIIDAYHKEYMDWASKAREVFATKGQDPDYQTKYYEIMNQKPKKPRMPRKPSKTQKETAHLTPEQAISRGRSTESTIEHEGLHHIFSLIEQKHGPWAAKEVRKKLVDAHDPDAIAAVSHFISKYLGYKPKSKHYLEELLAHSRDILVDPVKRMKFKNFIGEKADDYIKKLKVGHKKAYLLAQDLKPEDITSSRAHSHTKLAASEDLSKSPMENKDLESFEDWYPIPEQYQFLGSKQIRADEPLYHHVYRYQPKNKGNPVFIHGISDSDDPDMGTMARVTVEIAHSGDPTVVESQVDPEFKGRGYGKKAYMAALAHHGRLESDFSVSKHAQKAWQSLSELPGTSVDMKDLGHESPNRAYVHDSKSLKDHLYGKGEKLAASEDCVIVSLYEDESLEKSDEAPSGPNQTHPIKGYTSANYHNKWVWQSAPDVAENHDRHINNQELTDKFLGSIQSPKHRKIMSAVIKKIQNDPNRHAIPSIDPTTGRNVLRARHLKSLLFGDENFTLDTSNPDMLRITAKERHGTNKGPTDFWYKVKGAENVVKKSERDDQGRNKKSCDDAWRGTGFDLERRRNQGSLENIEWRESGNSWGGDRARSSSRELSQDTLFKSRRPETMEELKKLLENKDVEVLDIPHELAVESATNRWVND